MHITDSEHHSLPIALDLFVVIKVTVNGLPILFSVDYNQTPGGQDLNDEICNQARLMQ